ncbi:sulfotransferase domain-containing protein [Bythopirellula polymerisocia]|uniref:Sulfotransferase domain protein n=1 Tax=Bythopirellula polymerisocia TaxID=2528003 RepID=A0A5C6CZJ4_9BACT|nr:sulfotransferase domain-containing protein [Bythopirellula polymerisocia]TWU28089.1 Sulfotransferase domain protein [Bythopirellula polymerisocia]
MIASLESLLHHRSGIVRKGSTLLLQIPKSIARSSDSPEKRAAKPPVFANSFPKSGTHLLDQIVEAFPGMRNFGSFLSSMTSSFQFRERTRQSTLNFISSTIAGELTRAHLFFSEEYAAALAKRNVIHFFIYRDPRDVVISEAHYLRSLNRWHRLHKVFRSTPTLDDAIMLSIQGLQDCNGSLNYPDIGTRFERYAGWIGRSDVYSMRFEDLVGDLRDQILDEMIDFYQQGTLELMGENSADIKVNMITNIAPERSHTYRKGKSGGWRDRLKVQHREEFKRVAGDLLIQLGYEQNLNW